MAFRPLDGVRVLDVTTSLAGPYCAQILGWLGADVVKVEPPEGDFTRSWGPPFWDGESPLFLAANAAKRSVAIRIGTERGRDLLLELADRADVFLHSLRPGLAERRGLGPDDLLARNPRLVYCAVGAFGRTGPLAGQAGYDPLMQAASGIMSVTGEPDRPGVRAGVSLVDQGTGQWAALGVVAALLERERSGRGTCVDVSLYETAVALMAYHLVGFLGSGRVPGRHGSAFPLIAPYQTFPVSDGEVMVAAANDAQFAALARALDLPEDARFATNPARVERREELAALLGERLARESVESAVGLLEAAGVPVAPVLDAGDVARHEQTAALGLLSGAPHPRIADLRLVAPPLSVDGERLPVGSAPPAVGEHTAEVLREVGYADEAIRALADDGVVVVVPLTDRQ